MKNFQQEGCTMPYSNSGSAIASGAVVVSGSVVGIAVTDIAASTGSGELAIEGVFASQPKTTGTAWTQGLSLNWDVSTGKWDSSAATPATGDVVKCAIAWEAAGSGATTGTVKLLGGAQAPAVT